MVESHQNTFAQPTASFLFEVEEQSLIAKTGNDEECEDALYIGPSFVAVIDGATSKTERKWDGKTGGRKAALTLKEAFASIPPDATAREAVDRLTAVISDVYEQYQVFEDVKSNPIQRATASFVALSFSRKEIWFVGDCQCLINQQVALEYQGN